MTYDDFKDYVMTHLWKMGDSVVIAALDTIIATAEAELNRTFKVEDRVDYRALHGSNPASDLIALPADFREMRQFFSYTDGEYEYVMPSEFRNIGIANSRPTNYYTVMGNELRVPYAAGPTDEFRIVYYANLPPFKTTSPHWVTDKYFDVYLYCVLKHTAPFLREDERIPIWQNMFGEAFGSAMDENENRKFAGSPLKIRFGGVR